MSVALDDTGLAPWTCPTCGSVYPADFRVCPRDSTPRAEQAAPVGDPLIGEVLGRTYRITRVVGEGGMARLYEAEHLRIDGKYAVKVIHDELAREPNMLARFEREARAAAKIHNEHVVRLFDVLRTSDGRPCLITELFEGEDLMALVTRRGKLPVAEAIPIVRQLCDAVAAAHEVGVVHRDLKPSNVFLCKGEGDVPLVKVFDFGVAKLEGDDKLTQTEAVMGTAAYMAPEQARSAADAGPLADVYSIGAVLYHVLTGQMPYGNVPAISRFALVLHEEPARPRSLEPSIPPGVEAVIQHAMARETSARSQSAADLEAELAAFDLPKPAAVIAPAAVRTSAPQAIDIAVRARFARPLAAVVAAGSSIAVGAWVAIVLGLMFGGATTSRGERVLIGLLALIACAGVAALHVRILRPRWESTTAVLAHTRSPARALVAGVVAFGAFELGAWALAAVFQVEPFGLGIRATCAGIAAAIGLVWQRWKLGEKVVRWIG